MAKPTNLRSKSPRQLSRRRVGQDQGLPHAYRWGVVREGAAESDDHHHAGDDEPISSGYGLRHASRWGLTPSQIAPETLRSTRGGDTPTPPPVAVSLSAPAPRRSRPRAESSERAPARPEKGERAQSRRAYAWLVPLVFIAFVGSAMAWRRMRPLIASQGVLSAHAQIQAQASLEPTASAAAPVTTADPVTTALAAAASSAPKPGTFAVSHDGHVPIDGGVLLLPKSFHAREGGYDLIIHFHGDVQIVRESVEHTNINAALAVINWGIRSVPYREVYQETGRFEQLLAQIHAGLAQRGVRKADLRRMALTAWSGGYGAIESILDSRHAPHAEADPLDAVIVLDGIHAGFIDDDPNRIAELTVLPFVRAAKAAARDRILFSMTHSEIDPKVYASTKRSADLLLTAVGSAPAKWSGLRPEHLALKAASQSIGRDTKLEPIHDTRVGSFHVRGFKGITPEAHAAHLLQMAVIALPELAIRWVKAAPPRVHRVSVDETPKLPPSAKPLPSQPAATLAGNAAAAVAR
jgi:hypothetical protein